MEFDIYVPSKKVAIEYHGLHWHSEGFKGKADYLKYLYCRKHGIRLIQIYGDEWHNLKDMMIQKLNFLLAPDRDERKRMYPSYFMEPATSPLARFFLDQHHYLGAAGGCLTIIARHPKSNEIIGVWVFMKREAGTVLWHRACWDHRYKAWNPHEKALKMAIPILKEMGFNKILTFSDNRFHTGKMYEKIGFRLEREIPPDYSYTNGQVRKSKYALRVKAGLNERKEAASKGWYRIWDSGKTRFSLSIES